MSKGLKAGVLTMVYIVKRNSYIWYLFVNVSNLKRYSLAFLLFCFVSCGKKNNINRYFPRSVEVVNELPSKKSVWIFIMAGQSNMAGRAQVEPKDTLSSNRIFTIDKQLALVYAKEPLHFYDPEMSGLDCGLTFAKTLKSKIPDSISILLIPAAIGGTNIEQWAGDSTVRGVKLLTNIKHKINYSKRYGKVKGILWHQGESNAESNTYKDYTSYLNQLFKIIRTETGNEKLPILIGELGSFSIEHKDGFSSINNEIRRYVKSDSNAFLVKTSDLKDKGDKLHFDSKSIRVLGQRYADAFLSIK